MVYGYCRVSSERQRDNWSVEIQVELIQKFAESIGEPYKLYEEVKSAKNMTERKGFLSLIEDVQNDTYPMKKFWVVEQTRLARNAADAEYVSNLFQKHHVELYILNNFLDLSKASSRLIYGIQSVVAAHEREQTGERIHRSKEQSINDGSFKHSTLLGYSFTFSAEGHRLWRVDESESRVIRLIFKKYLEGFSIQQIARDLNSLGYKTKRTREFKATTVAKLLDHPEYFGMCRDTNGDFITSKIYKPILDFTYEEFLASRELRKPIANKFKFLSTHVSGVITCGLCGKRFYIHHRIVGGTDYIRLAHKFGSDNSCTQMPKYIDFVSNATHIDEIYRESFRHGNFHRDLVFKQIREQPDVKVFLDEKKNLEDQRANLVKKKERLLDSVENGLFTMDDLKKRVTVLDTDMQKLSVKIVEVEAKTHSISDPEYINMSIFMFEKEMKLYETASVEEKHRLLMKVVASCKITGNEITLTRTDGRTWTWTT